MHRVGVTDDTDHEKMTLRHLGKTSVIRRKGIAAIL